MRYNCHLLHNRATSWQFPATIVAINATLHFFATVWQIRATFCQGGKFQCHATFIFATYLNGGKILAGRKARCPLRLATSRKGLMPTPSEPINKKSSPF